MEIKMLVTPIEILDNAMKIGLGASIGILGAVVMQSIAHKRENEKNHREEIRRKLFEIIDSVTLAWNATLHYIACADSVIRVKTNYGKHTDDILVNSIQDIDTQIKEIESIADEATVKHLDSCTKIYSAPYILMILGFHESSQLVKDCIEVFLHSDDALMGNQEAKDNLNSVFNKFIEQTKNDYDNLFLS